MKILDKVWETLGLYETVSEEKAAPAELPIKNKKNSGSTVVSLPLAQKQIKVMVLEPASFDDAQLIADHLRNQKPVVVNFEKVDLDTTKRMIDFLSGTIYAINGSMQRIGDSILLCAPSSVDIDAAAAMAPGQDDWE